MAYVNDFKRVVDNVAPQIEVLQKAIELDPQNTIAYQRAIDFCETNQTVSQTILNAIELVEKDSKKTEDGQKKDSSETVDKQNLLRLKKRLNLLQLLKNLQKRKIVR
jgi:hypothetical protein|nr:MAG TPA: hypothetical protein [Caudoviricetes sp.]